MFPSVYQTLAEISPESIATIYRQSLSTFAIRDDGVKRCNIHSENKFVFVQEIEIAKNCKFDDKRGTTPKLVAQRRPALYLSQQLPSTYIKGSTNIFVARQVDHAR